MRKYIYMLLLPMVIFANPLLQNNNKQKESMIESDLLNYSSANGCHTVDFIRLQLEVVMIDYAGLSTKEIISNFCSKESIEKLEAITDNKCKIVKRNIMLIKEAPKTLEVISTMVTKQIDRTNIMLDKCKKNKEANINTYKKLLTTVLLAQIPRSKSKITECIKTMEDIYSKDCKAGVAK